MQNALVVGILIGLLCPIIGSFLIVQRMALLGDVIAHSVLPGLSISFFLGIDISIGAFVFGILGGFLIAWIKSSSRIKADAAMALTFSSFFAVGVILISVLKNKIDLDSFLFGDILAVSKVDILKTSLITLIIIITIKLFYKELLLYTFDKTVAKAMGMPVEVMHYAFISAVTLTVIVSMQSVGVILVIALMIGPALAAYLLVKELHQMITLGSFIGMFSSVIGVYFSYYWNLPSGPAIILVSSSIFLVIFLIKSKLLIGIFK
jgi:manganese/iron transport system permease protein